VQTCRRRRQRDLSRADVVVVVALMNAVCEWLRKDDKLADEDRMDAATGSSCARHRSSVQQVGREKPI
jgi:hypothetical protein